MASGEVQAQIRLKRGVDELLDAVKSSGFHARSGGGEGSTGPRDALAGEAPVEVGQELFEMLFSSNEVNRALAECMTDALSKGAGVRLQLKINMVDASVADLARLPWELLHDESKYKYFGLRPEMPIVRYLEVPKPLTKSPVARPLRILVVSANPKNDLSVDHEPDNLKEALGTSDSVLWVRALQSGALGGSAVVRRFDTPGRLLHGASTGYADGTWIRQRGGVREKAISASRLVSAPRSSGSASTG